MSFCCLSKHYPTPPYQYTNMQTITPPRDYPATKFHCEPAVPADMPAVLRIWAAGMQQSYPELSFTAEHRRRFRRNFRQQRAPFGFWVARGEGGEVLGWCSILPAFSHPLAQREEAEVSLYMVPKLQLYGVGTSLIQHVFAVLVGSGLHRVWGFAKPANQCSLRVCEKAGMRVIGTTLTDTILLREYGHAS